MNFFLKIICSGTSDEGNHSETRPIILTNYISLILGSCVFLLFLYQITFFGNAKPGLTSKDLLYGLALLLSPILVNKLSFTVLSRLLTCLIPVLFLWFTYLTKMATMPFIETSYYDGVRLFLLAVSPLPYLLFDKKTPFLFLLAIAPCFFSILFLDTILDLAGVSPYARGDVGNDYQLMGMRTIISYLVISASCFALQYIIIENDRFSAKFLLTLKTNAATIASQNAQLKTTHDELALLNKQLEALLAQKTESINDQHKKIVAYAYSNAHQVRASVARILGLIEVSKLETDLDHVWFLEKINDEAKLLDQTLRVISEDLNTSNEK